MYIQNKKFENSDFRFRARNKVWRVSVNNCIFSFFSEILDNGYTFLVKLVSSQYKGRLCVWIFHWNFEKKKKLNLRNQLNERLKIHSFFGMRSISSSLSVVNLLYDKSITFKLYIIVKQTAKFVKLLCERSISVHS